MTERYRRTPKNYDGTNRTATSITDLLPNMLSNIEKKYSKKPMQILKGWNEVIGKKLSQWTEPLFIKDGVLTVKVRSSTLYSLLVHQEKERLLKRLQEKFSKQTIRDIRFKSG